MSTTPLSSAGWHPIRTPDRRAPAPAVPGVRLLLIDDDALTRELVAKPLERLGYAVQCAPGGAQALDHLAEGGPPDLVLLDLVMPGFDGFCVLETLRKSHPSTELPVIVISGRGHEKDAVRALELGANDYVRKPCPPDVLSARIEAQLAVVEAHRELSWVLSRARALARLSHHMNQAATEEELLEVVERELPGALPAAGWSLHLGPPDDLLLALPRRLSTGGWSSRGLAPAPGRRGQRGRRGPIASQPGVPAELLVVIDEARAGGPVALPSESGAPIRVGIDRLEPGQALAAVAAPLLVEGELLGVLGLARPDVGRDAVGLANGLQEVAAHFAAALSSVRLRAEVERLAIVDALTGLSNRRFLLQGLDHAVSYAHRYAEPLSVLLLDVDFFKRVNDTHGHAAGDRVLAELSRRISGQLRSSDLAGRVGGEEIAIVLPSTVGSGAMRVAERLGEMIRRAPFVHDGLELPVTCSFGVAELERGEDAAALLHRADLALYDAKRCGRDRVVRAG